MRPSRVLLVSTAGLLASGLTFVVLILAQRRLDAKAFVDFGAVWGLIFGTASVLAAFELESARVASKGDQSRGHLPVKFAVLIGAGLSLLALAISPLLVQGFSLTNPAVTFGLVFSAALYPLYYVTRGMLAGGDRLTAYATVSFLEGFLRLLLLVAVGAAYAWQFTLAAGVGAAAFLPWLRQVIRFNATSDRVGFKTEAQQTWRNVGPLASGQIAGAIIITGMPATLTLALGVDDAVGIAAALVLVSISRIPLVLLASVYGVLVPWFSRREDETSPFFQNVGWVTIGSAGFVTVIVGAFALRLVAGLLFKIDEVGFWLAALYVCGGLALGALQILTARLVALDGHMTVQLAWWASAGVGVMCLVLGRFTSFQPALVAGVAQLLGPAVGLLLVSIWLTRRQRGRVHAP